MLGLKEAGVAGAATVLAGGVAYLVWVYASSKPAGKRVQAGRREEEPVVAAAAAAAKTSEVRRTGPDRTGPEACTLNLRVFTFPNSLSSLSIEESLFLICCVVRAAAQNPEPVRDQGPGSGPGRSRKDQPAALLGHRLPGAGRRPQRGPQRRLHQQGRPPRGVPGK